MTEYDIVIVGGGMAGIYSLYRMKQLGLRALLLEAGGGVGGTWYWNRYPGARVDVESIDYSFSFSNDLQKQFAWSEKFAAQPELLQYFEHVIDRFDLREQIRLNSTVLKAEYDPQACRWAVATADASFAAKYVIMATGLLSVPLLPDLPGLESYTGDIYTTGRWPGPVDFTGKRVGLFGNGSSGMQVLPTLANAGVDITLFQRTAAYAIPVHNGPIDDADRAVIMGSYDERRARTRESVVGTYWSAYASGSLSALAVPEEERERIFEEYWNQYGAGFVVAFNDLLTDMNANKLASDFVRRKIREIVKDPDTAAKLTPPDHLPIGCKRLAVENGFFEAFNKDHVHLVDLRSEPIEAVRADGIQTSAGFHALDAIIFATGFDAFSGAMLKMDISGPTGSLADAWADGPRNYLGMMVAGFPNMFMVNGPGTVAANFFLVSEMQADWIANVINHAQGKGFSEIAVTRAGEEEWIEHINIVAKMVTATNYCDTWFRGTNVEGKPVAVMNYLGGLGEYTRYCNAAAEQNYPRLAFSIDQAAMA